MSIQQLNHLKDFKSKIAAGKICQGLVIQLTDPVIGEIAGEAGFDFTWIDAEHGPHTLQTIQNFLFAQRGTGCAPFVRAAWNEWGVIKPILDLAPAGIIVPMVCSREEAEKAVANCKYPPVGRRGFGARRGTGYGRVSLEKYLKSSESNPMVIIQIEHIDAVNHLDEILKVPGIDSICIGPMDLSGSMGLLGQTSHPEVIKAMDYIAEKTHAAGLLLGTASGAPMSDWRARGIHWIARFSDSDAIATFSRKMLAEEE
ncbi:MAG: 4-hydroxy-3-methylbut-2-en-1-yl diphosphate synthase [Lentisphaeria bacterium]|nr:4-hydroxy-3-methylbut-2-en-1-yl diphosphate synthase [Lentisphaeria bacterium]